MAQHERGALDRRHACQLALDLVTDLGAGRVAIRLRRRVDRVEGRSPSSSDSGQLRFQVAALAHLLQAPR